MNEKNNGEKRNIVRKDLLLNIAAINNLSLS